MPHREEVTRKRYVCFGKEETNEERCHRLNHFYQAQYPDVPSLSSNELVSNFDSETTVLIDVRTGPERQVSKLEGAITLKEFEKQASSLSPDTKVVTYCTIGYRSGLEARRLQYQYGLHGRISSLDGIVAYTHAISNDEGYNNEDAPRVVCPSTGVDTNDVHTFGRQWDCVADEYETQHFALPVLIIRLAQVGATVVVRTLQYMTHRLFRRKKRSKVE